VANVPEWVAGYVGLPYVAQGRTKNGVDCWGLLELVWREQFGRDLPPYDGLHWSGAASIAEVAQGAAAYSARFQLVERGSERVGDGILIRLRGAPIHVGLVIAPELMLHVEEATASCIESYNSFQWSKRIVGFYRQE
jgi:cell wall-associated NlpC family hydrolase